MAGFKRMTLVAIWPRLGVAAGIWLLGAVGNMGRKRPVRPMDGMAESWEAAEEVRKSTREERVLLRCDGKPVFKPTVATISQHAHVLKPVMEWMHVQKSPPPVPDIKPLTSEIFRLYGLLNMEVGQDQVYREAWGVRLACGLIKRKGQRKEVSKAGIHSLLARSCFFVILRTRFYYCPFSVPTLPRPDLAPLPGTFGWGPNHGIMGVWLNKQTTP